MTETTGGTRSEPRLRAETRVTGLGRELVSVTAMLAGLAGLVPCLVHYGWWLALLLFSLLILALGVRGARREPDEVTEIEIPGAVPRDDQ